MENENRIIGYIENGIVIDHIPVGKAWKIVELLGIGKKREGRVSLGDGYESEKMGKKGVLKIEGASLSEYELNLIALVAKNTVVSIITDGKIQKKIKAEIPEILKEIVLCPNLNCISNDSHEKVESFIHYSSEKEFCCHYCAREFGEDDLKLRDY